MKYTEVDFHITPYNEAAGDVLSALLADIGFETFESTEDGIKAWIQNLLWDESSLQIIVNEFPISNLTITFLSKEASYENWNKNWEEEGFEPILIGQDICVHDSRHTAPMSVKHDIKINPRMAFGSGTHPTTQMLLEMLLQMDLKGKTVIDAGCGTGVLGILAMQCGATSVVAYDIDEWSTQNAEENFPLNGYNNAVILLGDVQVVKDKKGIDLVLANINRNILLADMPVWTKTLNTKGKLLVSGFYENDVPILMEDATKLGLHLSDKKQSGEWSMLCFEK